MGTGLKSFYCLYKKWIAILIHYQARSMKTLNDLRDWGRFPEIGRECCWWTFWLIPVFHQYNQYGDGHSWDCIPAHLLHYFLEIDFWKWGSPVTGRLLRKNIRKTWRGEWLAVGWKQSNRQDVLRSWLVNCKARHFKSHLLQLPSPTVQTLARCHGSNTHS